jgi:hypothetical protein
MKKILWSIVGILVLASFPTIRFVSNTVDSLNDCKDKIKSSNSGIVGC